ncbi:proline iminopeptidase-family hydrolase [Streptomyces sp. NPDC127106]|uniref:proline iminopeptidase-family hydrolase n=1 Tax=Streptomyces sp. NPDC127106 TaxID=3345360 RepID=UPI003630BA4F
MEISEGTVPFRGRRTWYRIVGPWPAARGRPPLLVLHGGPGVPHGYLTDLDDMTSFGRTVVYYDQAGCGRSDPLDDPAEWTPDTFVEEVGAVRDGIGLDRVHLFGHSWGGMLALEYALRRPPGLASLTLAGTSASVPLLGSEVRRLLERLPAGVRETLARHEAAGTTDSPEYEEAAAAFFRLWTCRITPLPEHVAQATAAINAELYGAMFGAEWNVTGTLRDWDVTARLGELDLPALVTTGRYDEITPAAVQPLVEGIRGAQWMVFEDSAHLSMVEEPERYRAGLDSFLSRVESDAQHP